MADRWAVANGNWSSTSTWNGGTLPASGDDVFADGFTVTIDQAITVLSIRTTQRSGGTAGGQFTLGGNHNVTANVTAGSSDCLVATSRSFTLTGNATGGTGTTAEAVVINATTATIIGNATGSAGAGISIVNTASNVTLTGNVSGANVSGVSGHGITMAAGTLSVTGTVTGGARGNGINLTGSGAKTVTINGDAYGSSDTRQQVGYAAIYSFEVGTITLNGTAYAGTTHPAVANLGTSTLQIRKAVDASNGQCAYFGSVTFESSSLAEHKVRVTGGTEISLTTGTSKPTNPFTQTVIA